MSSSKLNGATQIRPGTVPLSALVPNYAIPTANLADGANFLRKDGTITLTSALNFGGTIGYNAGTPVNGTDLVNKNYVDSKINGLSIYPLVRLVADSNVDITNPATNTFDGVAANIGDRLFFIGQTVASQNGPWVFNGSASPLTRPSDWAAGAVRQEGAYWITDPDGVVYKNSKFFTNNTTNIIVGTTAVTFTQDKSGTQYTNGNGISITGTAIALNPAAGGGLSFSAGAAIVLSDSTRGIQTSTLGVGIADAPSTGMIALSDASKKYTWTTLSGDATINAAGALTVNNTSGTGFIKYPDFVYNEIPGGSINGVNTSFTTANTPVSGTSCLYYNGDRLIPGSGNDYIISGKNLTIAFAPTTGDVLLIDYLV